MFDAISGCVRAGLTLALGWTVVGCGATGLAWVDQPESASGWSGPEQRSNVNTREPREPLSASQAVIPAAANAEPTPESRPRLNHTITLGEVDVSPPGEHVAAGYGPSVSVTINNYGPASAPAAGYGGVGYYYSGFAGARSTFNAARSDSAIPATRASRSGASMQPGQNWPAVADHGSSFPYRSAPASPWR